MKRIYNDFDQNTVMLLAQASYNAYPNSSDRPNQLEGYESICWFYGYDFRNKLAEEKMVAVYKKNNTNDYLFAFRGTDSICDMIDDFEFMEKKSFPFFSKRSIYDAQIASGFCHIYTNRLSIRRNQSLQQTLFDFLVETTPKNILITGHSLGAAMAEIFTIDLCNALKYGLNLNIETITHYNFACPRVGDDNFSNAYINYCIEEKKCNIIRFVNYYDYIPCFTPQFFSYKHVTDYYLFNFFVNVNDKCELENALAQNSIASYQNVLNAILILNKTSGRVVINSFETDTLNNLYQALVLYFLVPQQELKECDGNACYIL